jgi:protein-S-isoprenylcysteine O-methyltransferase Ste14
VTRLDFRNLPLPEPHLALLAAGIVLELVRPASIGRRSTKLGVAAAGGLIGGGAVVIASATAAAGHVHLARPDQLVTTGPYALSRHPMYESWTAIYVGIALWLRSGWLALLLPLLLALVGRETSAEERLLRARFGRAYAEYAARVPRYAVGWIPRVIGD